MAGKGMALRLAALIVAWLTCATLAWAQAQEPDAAAAERAALGNEVVKLQAAGKYAEAAQSTERLLALYEQTLGADHPDVATVLNVLATLYHRQGRHAEAERILKRTLALRGAAAEKEHEDVATVLNLLGLVYAAQGRFAAAEETLTRAIAIREKALGAGHPIVARTLNNLGTLYNTQGRYGEAEALHKRSLAILERSEGAEHPDVGVQLGNLGSVYRHQGRLLDAEAVHRRALAIHEKALGPEHPNVAVSAQNLATIYQEQGRFAEAEPLFRRSLEITEKVLGRDHVSLSTSLSNLANLYSAGQGRHADAEPLYQRSLAISEKALGPEHPEVATLLDNLAAVQSSLRRYAEAEPLHLRSLSIREKVLGSDHPSVATGLNNLAVLYQKQRRFAEAEPLYRRSLAIREKAFGPNHPDVALSLYNLAARYVAAGRFAEAEQLYQRSLSVREKALGRDHPEVGWTLSEMGATAYLQGDWAKAVDYLRRGTDIFARRAERGLPGGGRAHTRSEMQQDSVGYQIFLKAAYRLAGERPTDTLAAEMFETAQWELASQTAASLAQMAARSAAGSPQLAELARERQDLVGEWQVKDKLLVAAKSEAPDKRKAEPERVLTERLAAIDTRLAQIDGQLARDFPDYAALVRAAPVSVAEVQAQLGDDEALVLFSDTVTWKLSLEAPGAYKDAEATFIWVVTRSHVRWVRSDLGKSALKREVEALRCGLDAAAWDGTGAETCAKALDIPLARQPDSGQPLPFDHGRAHRLYISLFRALEDLVRGKHLLIVPSGPLTQLPFQVLAMEAPRRAAGSGPAHRTVAWLARKHPVTVLPAVASLKSLRRVGRPSAAPRPMIGFGNPLLDGPDARYAGLAKLARQKQHCPEPGRRRVAARLVLRSGVPSVATDGGLASLTHLRMQVPLPETADELCAVARDVKALPGGVRLGAAASEREVKRLSASGELAQYRVVHFATHGALAGELTGTHEPGLILSPPEVASDEDDGYLSASEVASLNLDADWVILSACNTAAGAAPNAEALSGLARAFIYAQARALLVSHWAVDSDATVKLVTGAVRELSRDGKVGRAEALRRAMLALVDKGAPHEAHPSYWASFVVVGEGGAGR